MTDHLTETALARIRNLARLARSTEKTQNVGSLLLTLDGIAKVANDALPVPTIGDANEAAITSSATTSNHSGEWRLWWQGSGPERGDHIMQAAPGGLGYGDEIAYLWDRHHDAADALVRAHNDALAIARAAPPDYSHLRPNEGRFSFAYSAETKLPWVGWRFDDRDAAHSFRVKLDALRNDGGSQPAPADTSALVEAGTSLAAAPPPPSHGAEAWRPISEAPKSQNVQLENGLSVVRGVYLLGYCPDESATNPTSCICVIWWEPNMEGGIWYGEGGYRLRPTHFMPLPAAPATEGR